MHDDPYGDEYYGAFDPTGYDAPFDDDAEGYDPTPRKPRTRSGMSHDDFLTEVMEYGFTRTEARNMVPTSAGDYTDALYAIESKHAPGYSTYRDRVREWNRARGRDKHIRPVSAVAWRYYPEHLRQRILQGQPVQFDQYGQAIVPEGHLYRKDGKFTFPVDVLKASWLGAEGDEYLSTFKPDKLMKRIQMLGAHQQKFLSGVTNFMGKLKAGPGSAGADTFSMMRGALVIGGEPNPAGMMYVDPKVGNLVDRTVRNISTDDENPLPVGTTWKRGEKVKLASGLSGFRSNRYSYTVADVAPIQGRYKYVLDRVAPLRGSPFAMKHGATKTLGSVKDLSGITDARGNPLNLDFLAAMKDLQGAAYEMLQAEMETADSRQMRKIAKELGYKQPGDMPDNYQGLGTRALMRLARSAGDIVQSIRVPTILHESMLGQYENTTKQVRPFVDRYGNTREGVYNTVQEYQAMVGNFAKIIMDEYNPGRITLGPEELANIQRMNPELAKQLIAESTNVREAYTAAINASLASGPSGRKVQTSSYQEKHVKDALRTAIERADLEARDELNVGKDKPVDQGVVARKFVEAMAQGPIGDRYIDWGAGQVTAPMKDLAFFSAEGLVEGREASKMLRGIYNMSKAHLEGSEDRFKDSRAIAISEQRVVAESEKSRRKAVGVTPGRDRLRGYKVMGSPALAENQVYVPGTPTGAVGYAMRMPTDGETAYDPAGQTINIGPDLAEQYGFDLDSMYVPQAVQQRLAGDWDADIDYWLETGQATVGSDGKLLDQQGNELDYTKLLEWGEQRKKVEGAGDLSKEHVGADDAGVYQGQFTGAAGRKRAIAAIQKAANNPHRMGGGLIQKFVTEGRKLYGMIGGGYNMNRRLFFRSQENSFVRGAAQKLWNVVYGHAQRPERLPADVEPVMEAFSITANSAILRQGSGEWEFLPTALKNLPGVYEYASKALGDIVRSGRYSPEDAAAMMSPGGNPLAGVTEAYQQYAAGDDMVYSKLASLVPDDVWAQKTPLGSTLGGIWAGRVAKKAGVLGKDVLGFFREKGVADPIMVGNLLKQGRQADAYVQSLKKKGISVEDWADAMAESGQDTSRIAQHVPTRDDLAKAWGASVASGLEDVRKALAQKPAQRAGAPSPATFKDIKEAETWLRSQIGDQGFDKWIGSVSAKSSGIASTRNGKDLLIGPEFFNQNMDVQQYAMLHEFGHTVQNTPAMDALGKAIRVGFGTNTLQVRPNVADEVAAKKAANPNYLYNPANEATADAIGLALGATNTGYIDLNTSDPATVANLKTLARQGLATLGISGGNGKRPASQPASSQVPAQPAQAGGGGGNNNQPTSPPAAPAAPKGPGGWEGAHIPRQAGAWFGLGDIRKMEDAAKQLAAWGIEIGAAVNGTQEFNQAQRSFLQDFKRYKSAVEKAEKTYGRMAQEYEFYKDDAQVPQSWKDSQLKNMAKGQAATKALAQSPGYQVMLGAYQHYEVQSAESRRRSALGMDDDETWMRRWGNRAAQSWRGKVASGLEHFTSGWELMRLSRMWQLTGAPVFDQYMPAAAKAEMSAWQLGSYMGGYDGQMPGGVAGGLMAHEAAKRQAVMNAGYTGYQAWGSMQQNMGWLQQARALLGPAAGVGLIAGGAASTLGVALGGMTMGGAAAAIGLPVTATVGTIMAGIGGINYARNAAMPTDENALKVYAGEFDAVNRARQIANIGSGGAGDSLLARGEILANTDFGSMNPSERVASLSYIAGQLNELKTTPFASVDKEQVLQAMGELAQYTNLEGSPNEVAFSHGNRFRNLLEQMIVTGEGPSQYDELASQFRMGGGFALKLFEDTANLPGREKKRLATALSQYAPMLDYGFDVRDVYQGVMSSQLGRREGSGVTALGRAYQTVSQFTQAAGIIQSGDESKNLLAQLMVLGTGDIEQLALGVPYAGSVAQATGMDRGQGLMNFWQMASAGASPMAMSNVAQATQGRSAVGMALNLPAGLAGMTPFDAALGLGMMSPTEYQGAAAMFGLGMSQTGWDMMAGGWGIGGQLGQAFSAIGMTSPGYNMRLHELQVIPGSIGRMGLYGRNALEQRGAAWANLNAQQDYTMEGLTISMDRLRESFEEFGGPLEDLSRAMAEENYRYQLESLGFARRGAEMSVRQSLESLGLQERTWETNTAFQRSQMAFQWEQMQTQQAWQQEDFAFNRQMASFQFEYSMDELERGLRYATGRERQGMLRRRDYMEEMFSMQERQRGTQEDRAVVQNEWAEEQFAMQKAHFEEITALQQEQFDMQRRHIMERYGLEMEKLAAQEAHIHKMKELEDRQRELQVEHNKKQREWQMEDLERQKVYYEKTVFPYQRQQLAWQNQLEDAQAAFAAWQVQIYSADGPMAQSLNLMLNWFVDKIEKTFGIAVPHGWEPNYQVPSIPATPDKGELPEIPTPTIADALTGALSGLTMNLVLDDGTKFNAHVETVAENAQRRREQGWGKRYG